MRRARPTRDGPFRDGDNSADRRNGGPTATTALGQNSPLEVLRFPANVVGEQSILTVEVVTNDDGEFEEVVRVYFDMEELADMKARLELIETGKADHVHLMSGTGGIGDLAETKVTESKILVHHLELNLLDQ